MRVHVLQHVAFEGLGSIADWLARRKAVITTTRFFDDVTLPAMDEFDMLIALGGPMSVNDEEELPWLEEEKRFIRSAIDSRKIVLGICLGAQLIANSLGARVQPGKHKEIGWFDIESQVAGPDLFQFPSHLKVFHWHGESFDLPPGAVHLARSAACENQAFQLGPRIIGLQFHLETTRETMRLLIEHCGHELVPGQFIQSETFLQQTDDTDFLRINRAMDTLLDSLIAKLPELNC